MSAPEAGVKSGCLLTHDMYCTSAKFHTSVLSAKNIKECLSKLYLTACSVSVCLSCT